MVIFFSQKLVVLYSTQNTYRRTYILIRRMGSSTQPVLTAKSLNIPSTRPVKLEKSPNTTKIVMKKILPIVLEDESLDIEEVEEIIYTQASMKLNQEEYDLMEQNEEEQEEVREIKVKWNSFIKMKKKNYLDDYIIIREIGRGGFGKVNKVRSKYTGIFRAAKKIKKCSLAKQDHEKLFAEMAIMQSLDHPNITKLFQVYDYKSHYVLILELCEGGELFKKILINDNLSQSYIAEVIKQILKVLLYLKHKGIVHRDLKPENMLFQRDSHILKIIDFGIAVEKQGNLMLTERVGTPYYVAPEVLLKNYDQNCDVWSTGVIMYMMMVRRPPFRGNNEQEVMENILSVDPVFSKQIKNKYSPDCISFVKSLLVKNPNDRLSVEKAFNHPWLKNQGSSMSQLQKEKDVIEQIGNFKFKNKLEAVVYTFIVSQLMTTDEKALFTQIFEELDKNHDGVISKLQFLSALKSKSNIPEGRMSLLMRVIDTNSSGYIDLTEFIVAGLKLKEVFNQQHFQQAFSYFDIDHSGNISYDQIAFFLQESADSEGAIKNIFQEVDENNDGVISREEFVHLLMKTNREKFLAETKKK